MAEEHTFILTVEPYPDRPGQYRWVLCQAGHQIETSASYPTKGEAESFGAQKLRRRVARWNAST
jgi:hypothetical protein